MALGVILSILTSQIVEIEHRYDEICLDDLRSEKQCEKIMFDIDEDVGGPIYVYY
jgi:hypothetical protein